MVAPRPDLLRDEYSTLTIMILLKQGMRLPLPLPSVLKWKAKTKQAPWEFRNKKTFHELLLGVTETVTPLNGQPHEVYINETGLYCLMLRSKQPRAKPFKRWITGEVLPSIRSCCSQLANLYTAVNERLKNQEQTLSGQRQLLVIHEQMLSAHGGLQRSEPDQK